MAERHALRNAIGVGGIHDGGLAETAATFGVFGLGQVASAGVEAQHLARGGDFEPLGRGFFRFDAFGTSHKFNSIAKERKIYVIPHFEASSIFPILACGLCALNRYGLLVFNNEGTGEATDGELAGGMSIGAPALSCLSTSAVRSISLVL
jgi:hypothetical protein